MTMPSETLIKRDAEIWEQHLLYKSLQPKAVCRKWGLTYSGYMQVLFRIKRGNLFNNKGK